MPSATLDQRQSPAPATVLRPPPELSPQPREPETWHTLTHMHHHPHKPDHSPNNQLLSTCCMPSTFLGHWGYLSERARQKPCPHEADNFQQPGLLTHFTNVKPRLRKVTEFAHSHTERKWQSQVRTSAPAKVQKAPSITPNSRLKLGE